MTTRKTAGDGKPRTEYPGADEQKSDLLEPIDLIDCPVASLREWLARMLLIRQFEKVSDRQSFAGKIPGGMHSSAGQEAVAVGAIRALSDLDIVTSSHRSHHHALAKGLSPRSVMAELYGKADGCLQGRAGHMHLADFSINLYGSNGIVGGGLGIALGAALAFQMREVPATAVGFFGDGGLNTGRVWEFINLAALWKLPLIAICENNQYAVETHISRAMAGDSVVGRAAGFGLPAISVDGQDVAAMYRAVREARDLAIGGEGPTFIEARTYRYDGHNTGDPEPYRTKEQIRSWRLSRDPIERLHQALVGAGLLMESDMEGLSTEAEVAVADAVTFAEASPWPDPATPTGFALGLDAATEADR